MFIIEKVENTGRRREGNENYLDLSRNSESTTTDIWYMLLQNFSTECIYTHIDKFLNRKIRKNEDTLIFQQELCKTDRLSGMEGHVPSLTR
jgi:hypothetical protein